MLDLNKKTISNLNKKEMRQVKGGNTCPIQGCGKTKKNKPAWELVIDSN